MSTYIFRKIMKSAGKNAVNVAADTGLGLSTIQRFLKGNEVHESTMERLIQWAAKNK